jgi:hypothetical protein
MIRKSLVLAALALALPLGAALPAAAQSILECGDWRAQARNLPEPWEDHIRSFANGEVRVALMDTVEPAAAAFYLLVLSPPYDELGERSCGLVGETGGDGFGGLDFARLTADYVAGRGLVLALPVSRWDSASDSFAEGWLEVTVNQATGRLTAVAR